MKGKENIALFFLLTVIVFHAIGQVKLPAKRNSEKMKAIIFIGLECPVSQKYMQKIEFLKWKYEADVDFFAVVPEKTTGKKIREFKSDYGSTLDFQTDASLEIVGQLKAKITPEVFLLTKDDRELYHGAIDNWFYELGKYRLETSEHYLVDAIESIKKGDQPTVIQTEAIGCFIQTKSKAQPQAQHKHHE